MKSETSNSKSFKFVFTPKQPRKSRPLSCPRKGIFRPHTMKFAQESTLKQPEESSKSKSESPNSIVLSRTQNDQKTFQSIHFDNFQTADPLHFHMRHNSQDQRLRSFLYSHFSTPSLVLNEGHISQILKMLPSSEQKLIDRLLANALKTPLHYPFDPPVYRGPAQDCTSINFNQEMLVQPKMIQINEAIQPFEEHLIKLFFKYFNPFFTVIHSDYFNYRLKHHWNRIDFQALFAMILCCACPYLAVEPFEVVVNHSQLAEMYFERSHSLYTLIDPNDVKAYTSMIQTNFISCQLDYNSGTRTFSRAIDLSKRLGWFDQFTKSTHEILITKPNSNNLIEQFHWEENLIIWCFLLFYSNIVLAANIPINGFRFEDYLPSIISALDALFHDCSRGWTHSLEARLVYFIYLGHPIFERARIYNYKAIAQYRSDNCTTLELDSELDSIKLSLNEWKDKFSKFAESCNFKPNELALVTGMHLFYHYALMLVLIPNLPRAAHQLAETEHLCIYTEFLLSCTSFSALTGSQGIWMVLYSGGTKNFVLSLAWSGVRLFMDFLETLNSSTHIPQLTVLQELATMLNRILICQLQANLNFNFQRQLNDVLVQRRSLLFWLAIRHDRCLANLSTGLRPRLGCEAPKPPKLSSHSTLNLLS